MKTVLCYGDSNTWGYDASTEGRYRYDATELPKLAKAVAAAVRDWLE